nr:hypothetical protein AAGMHLIN_00066 [Cydia pomonella granulovirus]
MASSTSSDSSNTNVVFMVYNNQIVDMEQVFEVLVSGGLFRQSNDGDSGIGSEDEETKARLRREFSDAMDMKRPLRRGLNTVAARLKTFKKWPVGLGQSKEEMVEAGLTN